MKKLIVVLALILSACTTCPPSQNHLIEVPKEYLVDTGDLQKIQEPADLESVTLVIEANYKKYHILREQLNSIRSYQEKMLQNDSNQTKK